MTRVVDASVACKWYLEETNSDKARSLVAGDELLIAPDLIVSEVGNVLWKRRLRNEITRDQANLILRHLPSALLLVASKDLAPRALEVAEMLSHPIYDCFYVAAAETLGAELVTDDRRFFDTISMAQIDVKATLLTTI